MTIIFVDKQKEPVVNLSTPFLVLCAKPREEESGDLAYSKLFLWNAITTTNVTDNYKVSRASYMYMHARC